MVAYRINAEIGACAFTNIFVAALFNLLWQIRIGNGWTSTANQIVHTAANDLRHSIGAGQPADADDRLLGEVADRFNRLSQITLFMEP